MGDEIRVRADGTGGRLTVKLSTAPKLGEDSLKVKYGVAKYDLAQGYSIPDSFKALVPQNTPEYVQSGNNYVERIVRALYYFRQCALIGPSGTGKTHIVHLVAELSGMPLWEVNCGLQTSASDLFGKFAGLGRESWSDGRLVSWCRYGGILCLDEANMMKPDVATRLNPLLDTKGRLVLNEKDNEVIPRNPNSYIIISMNPFAVEFAGTKPLNTAFRRRMSSWVDIDYLSVGTNVSKEEAELISKKANIPSETSEKMVRLAAELRKLYKNGDLPYAPSVGDLVNWAVLVADGLTPATAAEETIVSVTSDELDIRGTVRRIVQMIVGT